jgi:hypothetical protein
MNERDVRTAVVSIQEAGASPPTDLDGMLRALGDLDSLLSALGTYCRQLSVHCEGLPATNDLEVDEPDGDVVPGFICNQVAIHVQATAAGIDQARTAVSVAGLLCSRLRPRTH